MRKETSQSFMKIRDMSSLAFKKLFLKCKHPLNCIHHPKAVVLSSVSPWTNAYTETASFQIVSLLPTARKLQILLQQNNISYFVLNSKITHEESLPVISLCSALKYSC